MKTIGKFSKKRQKLHIFTNFSQKKVLLLAPSQNNQFLNFVVLSPPLHKNILGGGVDTNAVVQRHAGSIAMEFSCDIKRNVQLSIKNGIVLLTDFAIHNFNFGHRQVIFRHFCAYFAVFKKKTRAMWQLTLDCMTQILTQWRPLMSPLKFRKN